VLGPLSSLHEVSGLARRARASEAVARQAIALTPPSGRIFLVAASDPLVYLYPRGIAAQVAPGAVRCWSVLSAARASHRVTRTGERTLELEPIGRTLLSGSFDRLFRAPELPFRAGDAFVQCGATIRVTQVQGGLPSHLAVEWRRSLDDPELALLVWRSGRLERLAPPRVGESVELPWSPGPSGVF
jgi:hypothetical protein